MMQYDLISIQLNTMRYEWCNEENDAMQFNGTGMYPNPNTMFWKEITVLQNPNANILQMMHGDINANLYPMHTF